uniref:Uncharacterized protein AlNc14C262G9830 n=1 Tax=Albugo laibachii Nc14 TaxID=890382 RepID=F0WU07_9STRA|nr:sporangia induced conserved hypothetical protein [Albugo laibachii Nc14]|eukprot:CCA24851.1 sporangia induced conserved hypothetical protein [Albugo laibachii Nc14]
MQPASRSRYDVTQYAKKQQVARDRARELKEQRRVGILSEDHTFSPKVSSNVPDRAGRDALDELERSGGTAASYEDIPIRPSKSFAATRKEILRPEGSRKSCDLISSNQQSEKNHRSETGDTLDSLTRQFPTLRTSVVGVPSEVSHVVDGKAAQRMDGGGRVNGIACSRNSDCQCALCINDGGSIALKPSRRLKLPEKDTEKEKLSSGPLKSTNRREMESSLFLLKSKLSRRKARSAPTQQRTFNCDPFSDGFSPELEKRPTTVNKSFRSEKTINGKTSGRPRPPAQEKPPPIPSTSSYMEENDEQPVEQPTYQCDICHRKFIESVIERHQRICAKNSAPRKVYNMRAKRLEGSGIDQIRPSDKSTPMRGTGREPGGRKTTGENQIVGKKSSWKMRSSALREAMSSCRNVGKALKDGTKLPPSVPSAPDPSLIQCEYCSRRFNDKAADRHIPFCREKTQRDRMKKASQSKPSVQTPTGQRRRK